MKADLSLTLDEAGYHLPTNLITYQRLIEKLMYLACEIRPDIAFIVRQLSRHNSDSEIGYIHITKQTPQYLKRTSTLSII